MEQSSGFVRPQFPNRVCLLHKSIYGLKQASRAWFPKLSTCVSSICSKANSSLFIYRHGPISTLLLVYVDDVIIIGNTPTFTSGFTQRLNKNIAKDLGQLHYFQDLKFYCSAAVSQFPKQNMCETF